MGAPKFTMRGRRKIREGRGGENREMRDGKQLYGPQQQFANFARKVFSTLMYLLPPFSLLAFYAFLTLSLFLNQPRLSK